MKIDEFQKFLKKENIEASILFRGDVNINYFSENPYISASSLIVPSERKPFFVSGKLEFENLKNKENIRGVQIEGKLRDFLNKNFKNKKIGVNLSEINSALFKKFKEGCAVEFVDVSSFLNKLRSVKSDDEVEKIKKSCKIVSNTFTEVLDNFNFKTEREVEVALSNISKEKGGDFCFKAIVASGKNSANPHYMANSDKLNRGFCVIDFGVNYKGYASDMTRMVYIGKPKKEEIENYNRVLEAHKLATKACKDGVKASEVCGKVNNYFGDLSRNFIHGLGHGIGLKIHELPSLMNESEDILKKNMCFTIEPGLYFPGKYGIRFENSYLLKNKIINLTKCKEELKVL